MRRALQNNDHNRELERRYTYTERAQENTLDRANNVKHTKSETWDVVPLQGTPFRRLTLRDDKPLSAKEERQQEALRQKQDAERQKRRELREKETPEQQQKRVATRERNRKQREAEVNDVIAGFDFRIVGEEEIEGMPTWVIEGNPRKVYRFKSKEANLLFSKMKGRVWVSKIGYQRVRIDAETIDNISFGLFLARIYKGTRVQMEFTYINHEVWLPKREVATVSARIALVKGMHIEEETVYTNYRKFTADSLDCRYRSISGPELRRCCPPGAASLCRIT
jgi:hypothetical protein